MPKVSVIIPIYNVENYVEKCIKSLISQSLTDLEIILVDDGSTDSSSVICDKYSILDSRIVVIHKKNGGLVSARKTGLKIAKGDYIGFVDGDDYIDERMYEDLLSYISKNGADVVNSGFLIDESSIQIKNVDTADGSLITENIKKYILDVSSRQLVPPSIWAKLYKRDVIIKCYNNVPDEQSYGEDLVCLLTCLCEGIKIKTIERAYYHYITRVDSISNSRSYCDFYKESSLLLYVEKILKQYELFDELKVYLEENMLFRMSKILEMKLTDPFAVQKYTVKNIELLYNKKIILYGAGTVGKDYYAELSRNKKVDLVSWVDINYKSKKLDCRSIDSPDIVMSENFDYILIAVIDRDMAEMIKYHLIQKGIESEKIIWHEPVLLAKKH